MLIIGLITACAIWVYLDASGHGIGRRKEDSGFFNISAGAWGVVTLGLWIVAFPAYLIKRSSLIAEADKAPVHTSGRWFKAALLGAAGAGWIFLTSGVANPSLPACDSAETAAVLKQLVDGLPAVKQTGASFVAMKGIQDASPADITATRTCSGTLVTSVGEEPARYSVSWQDDSKSQFLVQLLAASKR